MKLHSIPSWSHYFITKSGDVYSTRPWPNSKKPRPLHRLSHWYFEGYPAVSFSRDGKQIKKLVHRLVLETFVGKCPKGFECLHRNGNRKDCHLKNLHWGSRLENRADMKVHGTQPFGEKHGQHKLTEQEVLSIRELLALGVYHKHIAPKFNIHKSTVSHIAQGHTWAWLKEAA